MTEETKVKRPHRTSMEGMIWNANHVLSYALRPGIRGIHKELFFDCAGIVLMSVVDAGFIFSGAVGTGILTARNEEDGSWSPPVACGMSGVGFGLVVGLQAKDLIILLPDEASVQTFFSTGVKLGGKTNVTVGVGREMEGSFGVSKSGMSAPLVIAYTKGAFASVSLEGAMITPRNAVNRSFYETNLTPADIVDGKVAFPTNKVTLWPNVVEKLEKLAQGISEMPHESEAAKAEEARLAADQAAEKMNKMEYEVVEVDAEAEAAKGA